MQAVVAYTTLLLYAYKCIHDLLTHDITVRVCTDTECACTDMFSYLSLYVIMQNVIMRTHENQFVYIIKPFLEGTTRSILKFDSE